MEVNKKVFFYKIINTLGDILYASDEMSRIIDKYKDLIILNKTNRYSSLKNSI